MKLQSDAQLLRIFIGENDKHDGRPVYELIVEEVKIRGLAGATVLRGVGGFGAHRAGKGKTQDNPPVVVEIVDQEDRIAALVPFLDTVVKEGLVTFEGVKVMTYRTGR